jgi:hypothetical protein
MRWSDQGVALNPSLTRQLRGVVLHDLQWRGRTFTVAIGSRETRVSLTSGPALPVITPAGTDTVQSGGTLTLPTRRPDRARTPDRARCQSASASSTTIGTQPLAAVDGSPATDWQPGSLPATLTVPLRGRHAKVASATLQWGRQWPPAPGPNIPPPPGPITVLRASAYTVQISRNGRVWRQVAAVSGKTSGATDVLRFKRRRGRFVRIRITQATAGKMPMLQELTVTR